MPAPPVNLGYGSPSEATIDQVNIWMRSTPWYQQLLRSWGQDPGHPHNLSEAQKAVIIKGAQANGVVVDEGSQEIDDNGNFRNQGHKLRNTLIVAGIAAATIATMGAAGVFGGAAAAGEGAAAGGVEAGATAGLDASVASGALASGAGAGLGTAAGAGAAGVGAGTAAVYGPTLASTTLPTATGTVAGGTGLTAAGLAGDGSVLGGVGGAAGSGSAVGGAAAGGSATDAILRYGIPTAGSLVGSLIQANAAGNASDAQQKYLQEALDYEKSRDAAAIALEGSRYSNYSGNIAPYLATGNNANARMSSLLGLPAGGTPTLGAGPVQPGPGGITTPAQTNATSSAAGAKIGAPTAPVTTGPTLPRASALVTVRAPTGETEQVKPEDVPHYLSLGATVLSGAA